MTVVQFTVPGDPQPQRRPRARNAGAHARVYDPKSNRAYRELVVEAWVQAGSPRFYGKPVTMDVWCIWKRPSDHWRKDGTLTLQGQRAGWQCMKHADGDNVFKAVADAMNGKLFVDDRQIVRGSFYKRWTKTPDEDGRVEVMVNEIENTLP